MKVRITLVIDVDVEAYRQEYGHDAPVEDIREDVKWSVKSAVEQVSYPEDSRIVKEVRFA